MKAAFPLILSLAAMTSSAAARDYCPERQGLGTPPCIIDEGRLSVEVAGLDWTREKDADAVTDTLVSGDMMLRYGVTVRDEVQLGWTAFGHVRERDRATGAIDRMSGTGDVTIGMKHALRDPSGERFSVALLPWASLPTGGRAIGAGDWGAGLAMPVSLPIGKAIILEATPEIDAAVDADRHGRHLAYGAAGGFQLQPSDRMSIAIEAAVMRDDDPAGHATQALAGLSLGLMIGGDMQIDAGTALALNHAAPDAELYIGLSRRF